MRLVGKEIIYVDDDNDDRAMMEESFEQIKDYVLVTVKSGTDLFEYLEKTDSNPCLIVLDMNMPIQNGFDIVHLLKKNEVYKTVPIIIYTTGLVPDGLVKARQMNIHVLKKPNSYTALMDISKTLLQFCC